MSPSPYEAFSTLWLPAFALALLVAPRSEAAPTAPPPKEPASDSSPESPAPSGPNDAPGDPSESPAPPSPLPPPWIRQPAPPAPPFMTSSRFELGIGLRGEGVAFDRRGRGSALALGGVGVAVRPRWHDTFALDIGGDFITGTDYNGFERTEEVFSIQPMLFFGRREQVHPYLTAGASFSRATVDQPLEEVTYHHIGADFGGGIEIRVGPHTAVDLDGIFFIRTRTDSDGKPEFVDPATGRTTNTSGGALLRATFLVYFAR